MRVLLDCRMVSWSGVGRYTTGLARALAARTDIELVQVCTAGETPPTPTSTTTQNVTTTSHPFSIKGALELGAMVRKTDPDLVHCPHFPTPIPVQAPLVVTLHDLIPLVFPESMPSFVKRCVYRIWNTRAATAADRIIVPSLATARDVAKIRPGEVHKSVVTPYAIDDFSAGPSTQLTARLAQMTSNAYILSMGNTRPHKDVPTLLTAFAMLGYSFPEVRLLLVGAEPDGYLQTQTGDMPAEIRERVHFTGRVDDPELRALYAGASVFICPSRYEGFGFPVLEAMALGAPVVYADAASLPEVAGDAALMFPPGDPGALASIITRVLSDPELRRALTDAGHSRATQYSWARTAATTVEVYSAVLRDEGISSSGWEDR